MIKHKWLLSQIVILHLGISLFLLSCDQVKSSTKEPEATPVEEDTPLAGEEGRTTDMPDSIEKYLDQTINASDFVITYHIGDSFSGETDLILKGDGQYELWSTVTSGREHKTYSGQVDSDQVQDIARKMEEVELWKVSHLRSKPGEDDPEALIGIETGSGRWQVVLWVSEIEQSARFVEVQDKLLALVREVSDGEVLETGR